MRIHRLLAAAAAAVTFGVAGAGGALADNVGADADNVQAGTQATVSLGTLECDSSTAASVPVWLTRNGSYPGPQVWANGAVLAISSTDTSALVGVTLGAGSVTLPGTWSSVPSGGTHHFESTSTLAVDAGAEGAHSVTVSYQASGAGSSGGTVVRTAAITVTWTTDECGPTNTPPQVSVTGVTDGGSYVYGAVPAAGCDVVDAEDAGESATPSVVGPASGIGSFTATCSYTDSGGLSDSDSVTYTVGKASSTVTVTCDPTSVVYTGDPQEPCSATVSGAGGLSSGLTVDYSDNTDVGTATASASFGGDDQHFGSSGSDTFEITQATSSVAVTCPSAVVYTGSAHDVCTATATGAGGLSEPVAVTYDPGNVDAGSVTANATWSGDANHSGSSGSATFTISKAETVVTITCTPGPHTYTSAPIEPCTATATGAGGLDEPVTVTYDDNVDAGTASAHASYPGDANHEPGSSDTTFEIAPAQVDVTISCSAGPHTYSGSAIEPCTAHVTGPGLDEAVAVGYTDNVNAGTATASASYPTGGNYVGESETATFEIDKAASTTTVTCSVDTVVYDATAHDVCTATVTGAGGLSESLLVGYAPGNVNAGVVTASASWPGDGNHLGSSGSDTFEILKAPSTVTVTCPTTPLQPTGSPQTPCTAEADGVGLPAPIPLTVSYTDNVGGGTATATASWAGDANHLGSSGTGHFVIVTWARTGFYQPVDMGGVYNTVKAGSTVPLKFEVFNGTTELTSVSAIKSFTQQAVTCAGTAVTDEIEVTSTGGTTLRYDSTGGQFIQNWQTPKSAGACYKVTMTTLDLQTLVAWFKLR